MYWPFSFQDVLASLQEKLNLRCMEHFSLALQNMKSAHNGRLTLLQDQESLAEVRDDKSGYDIIYNQYTIKSLI